jgi:2-polyprenyl-3-methyl-5-hydroxy-6-metoxy-1,4-benzoquinol methylase
MVQDMNDNAYLASAYAAKDGAYFGGARTDYVARLPVNPQACIVELGCGDGATGALALREGKCREYVGIEMFEPAARTARTRLTTVHVGNVDEVCLPYKEGYFDALIMSEVLEHLVDPQATLNRLARLVKPGGYVMGSSPNIAHWRIVKDLISGRFDYTETGAMDRTHLRWFTPTSYAELFEKAGIGVVQVGPLAPLAGRQRLLGTLLGSRLRHLLYYQINVIGRRKER